MGRKKLRVRKEGRVREQKKKNSNLKYILCFKIKLRLNYFSSSYLLCWNGIFVLVPQNDRLLSISAQYCCYCPLSILLELSVKNQSFFSSVFSIMTIKTFQKEIFLKFIYCTICNNLFPDKNKLETKKKKGIFHIFLLLLHVYMNRHTPTYTCWYRPEIKRVSTN